MEESGKSTPGATVTVSSADRNTKISFTCPCELNSVIIKGYKALYGSDKGSEKIKLVSEDEGTECGDNGVLYYWVVMREKRLQLLRPGEKWEPTSATQGEILEREMRLKEKQAERQHEIRLREMSLEEKHDERQHEIRLREMSLEEKKHAIRDREMSLKEETKKIRETGNKVSIGIGAVGGSVALVGAGIAACCACPPLAVVGILAGVGGSTLTAGSVGYVCTLPPSD